LESIDFVRLLKILSKKIIKDPLFGGVGGVYSKIFSLILIQRVGQGLRLTMMTIIFVLLLNIFGANFIFEVAFVIAKSGLSFKPNFNSPF
jgi:hypothetical protein